MKRLGMIKTGFVLLLGVIVAACGEMPMSNSAPSDEAAFARTPKNVRLSVLERGKAHGSTQEKSATIGKKGGTIEVGGVTLDVPAGALGEDVEITVTVPRGKFMQAKFAPHGLEFDKPVTIEWELKGSVKGQNRALSVANKNAHKVLKGLQGVYFKGELGSGAEALEIFEVKVDNEKASFRTKHFSGYCLAMN